MSCVSYARTVYRLFCYCIIQRPPLQHKYYRVPGTYVSGSSFVRARIVFWSILVRCGLSPDLAGFVFVRFSCFGVCFVFFVGGLCFVRRFVVRGEGSWCFVL